MTNSIYHSPYVIEYWGMKRGLPFIAELYRQGKRGEDPVMTYKRLTQLDQAAFCDEMFDACRHFVNWDFERVWNESRPYANQYTCQLNDAGDGWYRIAPEHCPENYGFNAIPLTAPKAGETVTIHFCGEAGQNGYHTENKDKAGWRYGWVSVGKDGKSTYGETKSEADGVLRYTAPADMAHLWLVVMGAPTEHWMNPAPEGKDAQWPYRIKITGSSLVK